VDFPYGEMLYRDRRGRVPDPYDPGRTIAGEWDDDSMESIELPGCYLAQPDAKSIPDATREEIAVARDLRLSDNSLDVEPGDRIRRGDTIPPASRNAYFVKVRPEPLTNPFTGWQPPLAIPLSQTEG
jgi:hypothetical protein